MKNDDVTLNPSIEVDAIKNVVQKIPIDLGIEFVDFLNTLKKSESPAVLSFKKTSNGKILSFSINLSDGVEITKFRSLINSWFANEALKSFSARKEVEKIKKEVLTLKDEISRMTSERENMRKEILELKDEFCLLADRTQAYEVCVARLEKIREWNQPKTGKLGIQLKELLEN